MAESWRKALKAQFDKPYFEQLLRFLMAEKAAKRTIFPPLPQVYAWSHACPLQRIRVVILGQDPYHGPGQAHGLCFSVKRGVPVPPSLRNMYKELETDVPGFSPPTHGDLTSWAEQGVLLLNAALTVRRGEANSHAGKGWEQLTDAVVEAVSTRLSGVVFILWGGYAQRKGASINKTKHLVISGPHPSPLSAYRGFFGCKHFSKANEYLTSKGRDPVDWGSVCKA